MYTAKRLLEDFIFQVMVLILVLGMTMTSVISFVITVEASRLPAYIEQVVGGGTKSPPPEPDESDDILTPVISGHGVSLESGHDRNMPLLL